MRRSIGPETGLKFILEPAVFLDNDNLCTDEKAKIVITIDQLAIGRFEIRTGTGSICAV